MISTMRGVASAPRNEPKMLVGDPTVAVTNPKNGLAVAPWLGMSKLGWLKTLNACTPTENSALSHFGIFVFFINPKSKSVKRGPRKEFRVADEYPVVTPV